MRRVVITGLGVVSPVGTGREVFWSNLTAGRSGIAPITRFDASSFPVRIAGEVRDFSAAAVVERFPEAAGTRDTKVLFALAAAEEALADAGLGPRGLGNALLSVGVGLEILCLEDLTAYAWASDTRGSLAQTILDRHDRPPLQTPLDRTAAILGNRYGLQAGRLSNCSACAAGTQAIGEAWQMLLDGQAEVALAGATDSMINPLGVGGFSLLHVLSDENETPHRACRPFDATRKGTVLGEGAAFLVLERLDHAVDRRATAYAQVLGYGSSLDAFDVSDPDPSGRGAMDSMKRALRSAGLQATEIDCVNAHGTGTLKNDLVETAAIKDVLGSRAEQIPVHAVKSMTGHMIAASGATEAVVAALTLDRGLVPPTMNLQRRDPQCDLDYVSGRRRRFAGHTVLSNSFGFGGQNATLILEKEVAPAQATGGKLP